MHLAGAFIQSDLRTVMYSGYTFFFIMCVPWESNPQPFALLTQRSTTEPQEKQIFYEGRDGSMIPVLQESQNFPSPNISVIKLFSIYNSVKKV